MKYHLRLVSHARPQKAELQPIWEFIFVGQALLGFFSTATNVGLQYLTAAGSAASIFLEIKGGLWDSQG